MKNENIYVVVARVSNDGVNYVSSYRDKNDAIDSVIDSSIEFDNVDENKVNEIQDMLNKNMYYVNDDSEVVYEIFETTIN